LRITCGDRGEVARPRPGRAGCGWLKITDGRGSVWCMRLLDSGSGRNSPSRLAQTLGGRAPQPAAEPGGRAAPTAVCPGQATLPAAGQGARSARPDPSSRPPDYAGSPEDRSQSRARRIRERLPSGSRAGRPLGALCRPDSPTDAENGQGSRRPAWPGSGATGQGLDGRTGLSCPRRANPNRRSPRTCCRVSAD
jgi:hypothetical protein